MPTGPAARITDPVIHPLPGVLQPGPGSFNVMIGMLPAWRGIGGAAVAGLQSAKSASDTRIKAAEIATLATVGTPAYAGAKAAEMTLKTAEAASMAAMITGAAASGGGADIHACMGTILPPHGPGVVIDGSPTVFINNLPACRLGDTILEAFGPPNKIAMGCPTVIIGQSGGGGGGGGGAGVSGSGNAPEAAGSAAGATPKPNEAVYASADEAARAALSLANPRSIADNLEYGGMIYRDANGLYGFTGPGRGTDAGFNPSSTPIPPGTSPAGDFHTHGDYSVQDPKTGRAVRTSDPARDDYNSDGFSRTDRNGIASDAKGNPGYSGYLGTPSGKFLKFDPATKTTSSL